MTTPYPSGQQPAAPPATVPARRRRWPWIAGIAIAIAVVVLAAAGAGIWLALPSEEDRAISACQDAINAKLKSPSSKEYFYVTVDHEDGSIIWWVNGMVDAQSEFRTVDWGAFGCTLTHEKDGSWTTVESSVVKR